MARLSLPDGFRFATLDDAERITRYHHAAWLARLHHLFPPGALIDSEPLEKLDRWTSWLAVDSDIETVVADHNGTAVGHTSVRGEELVHLFIDPSWQGSGLGGQLLDIGEDLIRTGGHETARLHTLVGNDAAIEFYVARGWVVIDELTPGVYFGHERNEHTLVKHLARST